MRVFALLLLFSLASVAHGEYRAPREVSFVGAPVTVYVQREKRTEVVFPESIVGALPPTRAAGGDDATEGMEWTKGPSNDRIFLLPHVDNYQGTMTLHGASGRSYIIYMLASPQPDISLSLLDGKVREEVMEAKAAKLPTHRLIEWVMRGDVPPGYRRSVLQGSIESRLVYKHGPIVLYVAEVYESPKQRGFLLIAENNGKTPVYFPIESLDFQAREIREYFGTIAEIAIDTPHLGPHPRYTGALQETPHQTFVYLVARRLGGKRGG